MNYKRVCCKKCTVQKLSTAKFCQLLQISLKESPFPEGLRHTKSFDSNSYPSAHMHWNLTQDSRNFANSSSDHKTTVTE